MTIEQYNNMLNELKYHLMEELKSETGDNIIELMGGTIEKINELLEATEPQHEARFNDYNDSYSDYIWLDAERLEEAIRLIQKTMLKCLYTINDYKNGWL